MNPESLKALIRREIEAVKKEKPVLQKTSSFNEGFIKGLETALYFVEEVEKQA